VVTVCGGVIGARPAVERYGVAADPGCIYRLKHQQKKIQKKESNPRNAERNSTKYISERLKLTSRERESWEGQNTENKLNLMKNRSITCATIVLALASFALPIAQAVVPPPDGGYPNVNTAEGQNALLSLTTGQWNTALGGFTLWKNTDGSFNTAVGTGALLLNVGNESTLEGIQNTAVGAAALLSNSTGSLNTATGVEALFSNTTGFENTAIGHRALLRNTTGTNNTANGYQALLNNTTGDFNTADGLEALLLNTTGGDNTANGYQALVSNTTGFGNIAVGVFAGAAVSTANNVIAIGAGGANVDNSCFIGQIYSNSQPVIGIDPDYVTITSSGRLGRSNFNGSSRRFKHDIKPMDKVSAVIFALKPVSFRYNKEYDSAERPSFGLIAEEVAQVDSDLVGRNKKGELDSVRYEQINAMLLNEFLKEHRKVQELEATVTEQKKEWLF
jgi:trimeric autotransporter adhesin